jgi:hypothetical protein
MKSTNKEHLMYKIGLNISIIVLLAFSITSCAGDTTDGTSVVETGSNTTISAGLQQVAWLEGNWMDTVTYGGRTVPSSVLEEWNLYPDSISGAGKMIKAGDTVTAERHCIRMVNDKLTYVLTPIGKALISFPLVSSSNGVLIFENPINEFPSRITYSQSDDGSLKARFQGYSQGREMNLPMTFVKE